MLNKRCNYSSSFYVFVCGFEVNKGRIPFMIDCGIRILFSSISLTSAKHSSVLRFRQNAAMQSCVSKRRNVPLKGAMNKAFLFFPTHTVSLLWSIQCILIMWLFFSLFFLCCSGWLSVVSFVVHAMWCNWITTRKTLPSEETKPIMMSNCHISNAKRQNLY